ncbi:50S ribosomal protein L29 [Candidatus Peregrinibacteria bacterium]|nr:50S ribosomal protein L29 [Candidatus Peregrinibacteria bacterium]
MLTIQELRSSTEKELLQELIAARNNALKVRVNSKTKHEKDIAKVQKAKRYVAQILTVLREVDGEEKSKSKKEAPKAEKKPAHKSEAKGKESKAK